MQANRELFNHEILIFPFFWDNFFLIGSDSQSGYESADPFESGSDPSLKHCKEINYWLYIFMVGSPSRLIFAGSASLDMWSSIFQATHYADFGKFS